MLISQDEFLRGVVEAMSEKARHSKPGSRPPYRKGSVGDACVPATETAPRSVVSQTRTGKRDYIEATASRARPRREGWTVTRVAIFSLVRGRRGAQRALTKSQNLLRDRRP